VRITDWVYAQHIRSGQPYFQLLDRIHEHLVPRTYVEIGVSTGRSLTLALPGTVSIGVDPAPDLMFPVRRGTRIFHLTSDDFFANHDLSQLFGGLPLDLAFIDGMHHFEFALRDFMNLERSGSPDTTIVIHDCLPIDEVTAARERTTNVWSGDVWRLIVLLRECRPELEVAVIDAAPTGLGLIRGLDPTSTVLSDRYDEIVDRYLAMPFSELDNGSMAAKLNVIAGDWPTVQSRLPDRPFRSANLEVLKARRALGSLPPLARQRLQSGRANVSRRFAGAQRPPTSAASSDHPLGPQ
jgi:hypothetical protein